MTRRRLAGSVAAAGLAALAAACGGTTNTGVIELNLDRPVDVSFACYGPMKQIAGANTAMPKVVCEQLSPQQTPRDSTGAPTTPAPYPGQEGISNRAGDISPPSWYGFILQSASGTVALTKWPSSPADSLFADGALAQQVSDSPTSVFEVLDADPLTPGKNALSIGEDPVAIVTDKTGCFEVTANAGSCDLSELDITSTLANIVDKNPKRPQIDRVTVVGPNGPLLARPAAMVAEPFLDAMHGGTDAVGPACPLAATSKVYIAYPSCHLVAEVELKPDSKGTATATVIGGIKFDDVGTPTVLTDQTLAAALNCPVECGSPGAPVGGSPGGVRPVALDYRLDTQTNDLKLAVTSRLAIGADTRGAPLAAPITVVDLQLSGATAFAPVAASLQSISLEVSRGLVGVSAVALSPQIGMGSNPNPGTVNDNVDDQGQFVYAIASDGSVRVADVLNGKGECDTQIDGRFLHGVSTQLLECLPIGRPDLPRRPGARGPGIELPDGEVAISVAIVKGLSNTPLLVGSDNKYTNPVNPLQPQPSMLLGYFAFITSSSGSLYVANIVDDAVTHNIDATTSGKVLATAPVMVMPHQLRNSQAKLERVPGDMNCTATDPPSIAATNGIGDPGGAGEGGPRLTAPAFQQSVAGTLLDSLKPQQPRLQLVECDANAKLPVSALDYSAPEVHTSPKDGPALSRQIAFPDLKDVVTEGWTLTYEGTLESDGTDNAINGPTTRFGQTFVDRTGMFIQDASRPFCAMGAEVGDIVEFRGCNPANLDADCPAGYTCYVHPLSNVGTGACFLKSEAPRLRDVCRDFLSSVRRYTVGADGNGGTAPGKLVLWQRKHELSTTPVDGCVSDDQCDDLARAAVVINQGADPFVEGAAGTPPEQRPTHWSCMADPLRKPIPGADATRNKRCVQRCTYTPRTDTNDNINAKDPRCASGTICVPDSGNPKVGGPGTCMEGIEPPQACLNGPQRYVVRAGEAFAVIGQHSGFVHPIIQSPVDPDRCIVDPNLAKDPLSIGRIPLNPPACQTPPPTDADYPFTGRTGPSTFEANPCLVTVSQFETDQAYPGPVASGGYGSCRDPVPVAPMDGTPQPHVHSTSAIKFRNRSLTLTIVDPYLEASQTCLKRDPIDTQTLAAIPSNIPLVVPGYQIAFSVKGGFSPAKVVLGVGQVSPVKVVRGPSESIWVIDDGDVLGSGFGDISTRGQVFRIESVPPASENGFADIIINDLR